MPNTVSLTIPGTDRRAEVHTGLFVDGRWGDPPDTFPIVDPATGEPVATVSTSTV